MKERNIGLDLLRIIAMIMIVSLHVLGKGQFISDVSNNRLYQISALLEIVCIVAVNCYVLITGYFQIDSKFRVKKVVSIWVKVLLYSITIYIILMCLGVKDFSAIELVRSFFPIITNVYWFVNCYLLLYILSPFLNKLIKNLNKKEFRKLLAILLFAFCILPTVLPERFNFDRTAGYGIIWFVVLYFVGAYIKLFVKDTYKNRINLYIFIGISIFSYISFLVIKYICSIIQITDLSSNLYNYNFITVFLAAVFLFLYFKNLKINGKKFKNLIAKIAPLTFAVYIIHEQVVLRKILYSDILKLNTICNNLIQILIIPLVVIIIFLICILIERITKDTIQKRIVNLLEKIYNRFKETKFYEVIQFKLLQNQQLNDN